MGREDSPNTDLARLSEMIRIAGPRLKRMITERWSKSWTKNFEPEDILQEVYIETFKAMDRLVSCSQHQLELWMTKVARNKIWDRVKSMSRAKRGGAKQHWMLRTDDNAILACVDESAAEPSRAVASLEAVEAVRRAVDYLPEPQKNVMRLYLDQVPVFDIAKRTLRTESAIRSLLGQGKRNLRRLIKNPGQFFSDSGIFDTTRSNVPLV